MEPKDRLIRDEESEEKVVTEIICLVDRSGSMQKIIEDAVGGFNSFLADQRALPDEAYLTLYTFDDKCEIAFESVPVKYMADITRETIKPRGSTALWDAIGSTLADSMSRVLDENKTIVVILTDGAENCSRKYSSDAVSELVKECKESGWEFLFLGANIDAFATGKQVGFDVSQTVEYEANSRGIQSAYTIASNTVSQLRSRR